eukprot:550571-Pelagomonas_calceolata.AAC.4
MVVVQSTQRGILAHSTHLVVKSMTDCTCAELAPWEPLCPFLLPEACVYIFPLDAAIHVPTGKSRGRYIFPMEPSCGAHISVPKALEKSA